jgi:hypothetical protein
VGPNCATVDHPLAVYQTQRLPHVIESAVFHTSQAAVSQI